MIVAPQHDYTLIAAAVEGDSPAGGLNLQNISLLMVVLNITSSLMYFPLGLKSQGTKAAHWHPVGEYNLLLCPAITI